MRLSIREQKARSFCFTCEILLCGLGQLHTDGGERNIHRQNKSFFFFALVSEYIKCAKWMAMKWSPAVLWDFFLLGGNDIKRKQWRKSNSNDVCSYSLLAFFFLVLVENRKRKSAQWAERKGNSEREIALSKQTSIKIILVIFSIIVPTSGWCLVSRCTYSRMYVFTALRPVVTRAMSTNPKLNGSVILFNRFKWLFQPKPYFIFSVTAFASAYCIMLWSDAI